MSEQDIHTLLRECRELVRALLEHEPTAPDLLLARDGLNEVEQALADFERRRREGGD